MCPGLGGSVFDDPLWLLAVGAGNAKSDHGKRLPDFAPEINRLNNMTDKFVGGSLVKINQIYIFLANILFHLIALLFAVKHFLVRKKVCVK